MTKEQLDKAKSIENEMIELELDITGYECMVRKLMQGKVVLHVEGIVKFSFKVDKDLESYMIQHYQEKISNRKARMEILKKQFNEL